MNILAWLKEKLLKPNTCEARGHEWRIDVYDANGLPCRRCARCDAVEAPRH